MAVIWLRGFLSSLLLMAGCTALVLQLCGGNQGMPAALDQTLENFLGGGNKLKADDLDSQLEKYRVMRNVALAAMGHHSLTELPKESPSIERERLKQLKLKALQRLRNMASSRGRTVNEFGMHERDESESDSGSGPTSDDTSSSDCSQSDANLGLCEDDSHDTPLDSAQNSLKEKEQQVSDALRDHEKKNDEVRKTVEGEVDRERLKKAQALLNKLTSNDSLINELVHHTIKVAGMAPATPDA